MKRTKKLIISALMIAIAAVLQIAESTLPVIVHIPGGKLGFANIVTMAVIPILGYKSAILIAILRAALGSMLYGGPVSAMYSIAGAILSSIVMCLLYKYYYGKISFYSIGCIGAAVHNTAQVTVAYIITGSAGVFIYLPLLLVISAVSGTVTGGAAQAFINKTKGYF